MENIRELDYRREGLGKIVGAIALGGLIATTGDILDSDSAKAIGYLMQGSGVLMLVGCPLYAGVNKIYESITR